MFKMHISFDEAIPIILQIQLQTYKDKCVRHCKNEKSEKIWISKEIMVHSYFGMPVVKYNEKFYTC